MILVATCLIPARSSVDSDASLGEKSATRHKCGHERSRRLLGLACCTLTHSLSRLVSDTGATTRRVRGTAAVVGVSCYLESGSRKREKKQDHHRFFGDPAFYQGLMFRLGVAAFHLQSL
ncbi:unnamed protein product [Sphagnum jensenii]